MLRDSRNPEVRASHTVRRNGGDQRGDRSEDHGAVGGSMTAHRAMSAAS